LSIRLIRIDPHRAERGIDADLPRDPRVDVVERDHRLDDRAEVHERWRGGRQARIH
jgi:hypothetical protein